MTHAYHALPAHVQLMRLITGKWLSQPLYVLADLRVCDELAAGPLTAAELAPRVGADPDILYRLMRAVAALGLLAEEDGRFRLLPLGEPLRSDVPCSVRDLTVFLGSRPTWESFAAILHTARTGKPAFDAVHGQDFFSYLAGQPELARAYQGGLANLADELGPEAVKVFDFARFPVLADIGGGHGRMLLHILRANSTMTGLLIDRAEMLDIARVELADEPEVARITLHAGVLPDTPLPAADAYLLKNTLHCFGDETARQLLAPLAAVLRDQPDRRLLIIETVVSDDNSEDWSKFMDIEMMVNTGGRERTRAEWEALLTLAGLRLAGVTPVAPQSILEAAASGAS